ncbi:hypothetical protein VTK73DRAFT_8404 [Phialemonium thermophilum]|uniref:Aldose 1-epimerase n=1 Tax=Phialemonium thermophilum TaxID=223376 RepID=A0ABR3W8X5_9PEZI
MRLTAAIAALLANSALGQSEPKPGPDGTYEISAPGIRAQFIPYGATMRNLFVKDKNGYEVDVVLGYDDIAYYPKDPGHPVYNSIPGRYVNRIGHATYTLNGTTYHTEQNDGNNTLHGGTNNWSYRFWNVTALSNSSITFSIHDPANLTTGFPGSVDANVTYTLTENTWHIKMQAVAPDTETPLMLTHHTYFNLDAFKNPATDLIWDHTLYLPTAHRYLELDGGALPTGKILTAAPGSVNDFYSSPNASFGRAIHDPAFKNNCGSGCDGYNGYWIFDAPGSNTTTTAGAKRARSAASDSDVVLTLASPWNGIKADLRTDQPGVQVYSCFWMDGTAPLKSTQGTASHRTVKSDGCVAIEAQDYVDGINHPEWGRLNAEITGPGKTYNWESSETGCTVWLDTEDAIDSKCVDCENPGLEAPILSRLVPAVFNGIWASFVTWRADDMIVKA